MESIGTLSLPINPLLSAVYSWGSHFGKLGLITGSIFLRENIDCICREGNGSVDSFLTQLIQRPAAVQVHHLDPRGKDDAFPLAHGCLVGHISSQLLRYFEIVSCEVCDKINKSQ